MDAKWQEESQNLMLGMAEKLDNIEKIVQTENIKDEIMMLSDSNGKFFKPSILHREKKVTMEHIYTLDGATKNIPTREYPEKVTDIVFMTGLNDSHDHLTSVEEIMNRQKDACHIYHHKFRKARFHIVAVAPESQKQRKLNKGLQEYAVNAGISYVDNNGLIDVQTGNVKPNIMDGYHYTPLATKIVAGQLERSLYANEHLQPRNNIREREQPPSLHNTAGNQPKHRIGQQPAFQKQQQQQ